MNSPGNQPESTCPRCGTRLSIDELAGGCPRCFATILLSADLFQPATADADRVIRRVGDYELLEEIARGGMGIVYRARQITLNREVAVKLMRDSALAGAEVLSRLCGLLEWKKTALLDQSRRLPGEHRGSGVPVQWDDEYWNHEDCYLPSLREVLAWFETLRQ